MVEGVNSRMMYLIHCKDFCKCYNVPLHHNKTYINKSVLGEHSSVQTQLVKWLF
jgi:hypothetical protein